MPEAQNITDPSKPGYVHVDFFPTKSPPVIPTAPRRRMSLGWGVIFYLFLALALVWFAANGKGISYNTSIGMTFAAMASGVLSLLLLAGWVFKKVVRLFRGH